MPCVAALTEPMELDPPNVYDPMCRLSAARTAIFLQPMHLEQGFLILDFDPIKLLELGNGEPFLNLKKIVRFQLFIYACF